MNYKTSTFQQTMTNVTSLCHQASDLPGIIYVGKASTMKCDLFHPNIFHQLSYSLQMYEGYILTTTGFPLVYLNDPFGNYHIDHTPGKQDHITINILFQLNYLNLIHTKEVDLLKFKQNNDLPP